LERICLLPVLQFLKCILRTQGSFDLAFQTWICLVL
jgi:hypothetical protein